MLDLNIVLQIVTENPKVVLASVGAFLLVTGIIALSIDGKSTYGALAVAFGLVLIVPYLDQKGRKRRKH